jgi:hypothetical protein
VENLTPSRLCPSAVGGVARLECIANCPTDELNVLGGNDE